MLMLILRRLQLSLLIIFLAVTALYVMIHMVPGDPVNVLLGPRATPELRQELIDRLRLDQPIHKQLLAFYSSFLIGVFVGFFPIPSPTYLGHV